MFRLSLKLKFGGATCGGRTSFHELKLKVIFFSMLWDPMGRWLFFYDLRQLLLECMLELEMLNPRP